MAKNQKKAAPVEVAESEKEVVRVTFRLHGPELAQVREVQEMMSLNSELDAARYLMQRGLEVMSATLASRRTSLRMAEMVTPQTIVGAMAEKLNLSPEDLKKLG